MKTHDTLASPVAGGHDLFPDADDLAALRAWYAGLPVRDAVARYLGGRTGQWRSSRGVVGDIRRRLAAIARDVHRHDLAALFAHPAGDRTRYAGAVAQAIEILRHAKPPEPQITDSVGTWFSSRTARTLHASGIVTLADLTVRVPRRRRWWAAIPGLGHAGARHIETFFASHPELTERARALVVMATPESVVPWERLRLSHEVDGSHGTFRAPAEACALDATNDYEAVQAWLSLHEAPTTLRAYRKEAERLILWAVVERGRALSSLTTEDAVAYRAFLRRPTPRGRWIGPSRPRTAPDWRPFAGNLSPRSASYALSVLGALFRWLIEKRYVLANPFAGVKVRERATVVPFDTSRGFTEGEWLLVRTIADGLEWSYGWSEPAAQRLRFILDFAYATGLRAGELVSATLGDVRIDGHQDHWLHLTGKGSKPGKVALPPLARSALDHYLAQRGLPVSPVRWEPGTALVGALDEDSSRGITGARLWHVMRRFFHQAASLMGVDHPALAGKLRCASPHWMRHTHASHALARGAELITVRDNLRHASIATTSIYLQGDDIKRARQMDVAFGAQ